MAKLLAGRFNRFVEKLFATKEGRSSLDTISPELQMTYTMLTGVEDRYLQGWNRFAQFMNPTAVAAQFCKSQLRNPTGSGVIGVVESIIVANTAADTPSVSLIASTTDLTTASTIVNTLDPRGGQQSVLIRSLGTTVAGAPNVLLVGAYAANGAFQFIQNSNQEIPILPGQAIIITSAGTNQTVFMTFVWRERVLEPSELS